MIRNRVTTLLLLLKLLAAASSASAASPVVSAGRLVTVEGFESAFVPARDIFIWLPPAYSAEKRYAVLFGRGLR